MPLSEFLSLAREKLESADRKSDNHPTGLSTVDNDLVELGWNNGQLMLQGHSNRARKSPTFDDIPSPGVRGKGFGNATHLKAGKFASLQFMDDAAPSVPSADLLTQDNEMEPWLNSSIDESCKEAYFSDILPEISGVAGTESSLYNSFREVDKRNYSGAFGNRHNVPMHTGMDFELQNSSKVCSSSTCLFSPYATNHGELSIPLMGNSSSQTSNVFYRDSNQGQTSENAFMNMMPEKQNTGISGSGSCLFNFTHFSRPAAMCRSNVEKTDGLDASCSSDVKGTRNEEKIPADNRCIPVKSTLVQPSSMRKETGISNEISLVPKKADLRPAVVKSPVESCPAEPSGRICHEDTLKNDKLPGAGVTKGSPAVEKNAEPLLPASSACSGNSAEVASIDQMHKRKERDNEESDSRSEDNEEESLCRKKTATTRGVSGTKRSRTAEVHNLSERRRRVKINEKMRALQELIPNCNKADKASMLDEAIEYLKTLQLQVQVMSMGSGLCMPQMMFPTALPPMHGSHIPYFPPMGGGMGMGMGFRMGMIDMNSGAQRFPMFPVSTTMQGARFPSPPMYAPSPFQGFAGQNLQVFEHPGQGHPLSIPRVPPLFPSPGHPPVNKTVGSNSLGIGIHADTPKASPLMSSDTLMQNKNSQVIPDADGRSAMDQTPSQPEAANGSFDHPFLVRKGGQVPDACGAASVNFSSSKDDSSSKDYKEGVH